MPKGPPLRVVIEPLYLERKKVESILNQEIEEAEDSGEPSGFIGWLEDLRDRLLDG